MNRFFSEQTVTIANGVATSARIAVKEFSSGSFQLPSAFSGTSLAIEVSVDGTTFVALKNAAGSAVTVPTTSTNDQLPIPAEAFSFPWIRLKAGSNQAADRSVRLFLKA